MIFKVKCQAQFTCLCYFKGRFLFVQVYSDDTCTIFVLVYVDDIIIASSSSKVVDALMRKLNQEFALKDLGDLHYFLGIEVKRTNKGLLMTQERYALDILQCVNMSTCKAVSTPISLCEKLLVNDGEPLWTQRCKSDRSIVGALLYLTLTQPDISFAVNRVCQFLHSPTFHLRLIEYVSSCIVRHFICG
jgi:hypothetical protein